MRIITFANEKGGVGKTTSSVNVADALCRLGKKVLLIDCDGQGSLTMSLGLDEPEPKFTIKDFLEKPGNWQNFIAKRKGGLDVICEFNRSINEVQSISNPKNPISAFQVLKKALLHLVEYNFVIIDSTPAFGAVLNNILTAVDEVIIPLQTHRFAESGCADILLDIEEIKALNPNIKVSGIFLTFFEPKKAGSHRILKNAKEAFGNTLMDTKIRFSSSIKEGGAVDYGMTLFEYAELKLQKKKLAGAEDYMNLAKEIIKKGKDND